MADKKPTIVSSFSVAFKKAANLIEDVEEAKKVHRQNLSTLVDKYMRDIKDGKAEGIRNAKELVEVIKADLLLMGEANDRSENTSAVEEARVTKVMKALDENDPTVQDLMSKMFDMLNEENDAAEEVANIEQE